VLLLKGCCGRKTGPILSSLTRIGYSQYLRRYFSQPEHGIYAHGPIVSCGRSIRPSSEVNGTPSGVGLQRRYNSRSNGLSLSILESMVTPSLLIFLLCCPRICPLQIGSIAIFAYRSRQPVIAYTKGSKCFLFSFPSTSLGSCGFQIYALYY
jgi:hypothetical protein